MTSAPTINAIPTIYRGVTFRSRLEARWAIFFDALSVRWEYEPEGYSDGTTMYLPDFWLPELDAFWEVKPDGKYDEDKATMLVTATKKRCLISNGPPSTEEADLIHEFYWLEAYEGEGWEQEAGVGWDNYRQWCACPRCGKLGVEFSGYGDRICGSACNAPRKGTAREDEIEAAATKARTYQFTTRTSPQVIR